MPQHSSLFERYIRIEWDHGIEHVPLAAKLTPEQREKFFVTQEFWRAEKKQVFYRPELKYSRVNDGEMYHLRYRRKQHPELANLGVAWGTSQIEFEVGRDVPAVRWRDEGQSTFGSLASVTVHEADANWMRDSESIKRPKRKQDPLRQALFDVYGWCAITGERTAGALEAAHVIDVKRNGGDFLSNALLLRADLHALFDRNMFNISPDMGRVCGISTELSQAYQKLLSGKVLPLDVFKCISENLSRRALLLTHSVAR